MQDFCSSLMWVLLNLAVSACMRIRLSRNCAAARTAAAPGLLSSCIRPAASMPEDAIFSCWTTTLWNFWKRMSRYVAEHGFAHAGAGGHQVPNWLFVELQQLADARTRRHLRRWGCRPKRQFAHRGSCREAWQRSVRVAIRQGLRDAHLAGAGGSEEARGLALAGEGSRLRQVGSLARRPYTSTRRLKRSGRIEYSAQPDKQGINTHASVWLSPRPAGLLAQQLWLDSFLIWHASESTTP